MLSTDRRIAEPGSAVRARMEAYGDFLGELHIILFSPASSSLKNPEKISPKAWLYPTNSFSRWLYVRDAVWISRSILNSFSRAERSEFVVSCQDPFETGLVGKRLKRLFGIRLHIQVHTDIAASDFRKSFKNKARLIIARGVLAVADRVRAVSKTAALSLEKYYGVSASRIDVLPIFVDVLAIKNGLEQSPDISLKYQQFEKKVLSVSRLEKEKDLDTFISVADILYKKDPSIGFIIVGDGRDRTRLNRRVKLLGLEKNVVFAFWQNDPLPYFKMADIFLLTSRYEGYGLALIEAAAAGLPIVTTRVGIASELFTSGQSALICNVADAKCLAHSAGVLLNDQKMKAKLVAESSKLLSGFPAWEDYKKNYKDSLEKSFRQDL